MAQVLTMRSCKKTKKSAIRKFKALCHYYNKHSKFNSKYNSNYINNY